MGFKIPKSIDLLILLTQLKLIFTWSLARLGLIHITPQENNSEEISNTISSNYVLIQWPTNSVVPIPVPIHIIMSAIKRSVPVIEYRAKKGGEEDEECSVCLSCIEGEDEIRELSNCAHMFHKECLDHWVDVGQVTCPLCRSMLFPLKGGDTAGQNPCFLHS